MLGGKGSLVYNADGSMSYIYDNELSFQHATQMISSGLVTQGLKAANLAKEGTARVKDTNATKAVISGQQEATKQAVNASKQAVTSEAIKANPAAVVPPVVNAP